MVTLFYFLLHEIVCDVLTVFHFDFFADPLLRTVVEEKECPCQSQPGIFVLKEQAHYRWFLLGTHFLHGSRASSKNVQGLRGWVHPMTRKSSQKHPAYHFFYFSASSTPLSRPWIRHERSFFLYNFLSVTKTPWFIVWRKEVTLISLTRTRTFL